MKEVRVLHLNIKGNFRLKSERKNKSYFQLWVKLALPLTNLMSAKFQLKVYELVKVPQVPDHAEYILRQVQQIQVDLDLIHQVPFEECTVGL